MKILNPEEYRRREGEIDSPFYRAIEMASSDSTPGEVRTKMEETAIKLNGMRLLYRVLGDILDTHAMRTLMTIPRERLPGDIKSNLDRLYQTFEVDEPRVMQELKKRGLHTNNAFVESALDAPELIYMRDVLLAEQNLKLKGNGGRK
jgi:hypothetical protein